MADRPGNQQQPDPGDDERADDERHDAGRDDGRSGDDDDKGGSRREKAAGLIHNPLVLIGVGPRGSSCCWRRACCGG
ncbi:MAG: hypothetical protein WDM92_08280 [Caulobacteraceae bacterium]